RRPLHQALQAGLAVRVHVRGLGASHVETTEEGADLAPPVLRALHDALEVPTDGAADGEQRLDAAFEAPPHAVQRLQQLRALVGGVGRAALGQDLRDRFLADRVLGRRDAAEEVEHLVDTLRPPGEQEVARREQLAVGPAAQSEGTLASALLRLAGGLGWRGRGGGGSGLLRGGRTLGGGRGRLGGGSCLGGGSGGLCTRRLARRQYRRRRLRLFLRGRPRLLVRGRLLFLLLALVLVV